ncbi:MAG: hypothetical protein EKK51_00250 [Mycolicibacterium sp.]|uniref:hypothetical protein n=1 Tax=Mycolicibacterium sp. TaxID=2320850 RepID=UPI000F9390BE|nr:hypothetical protein [Mycolicibacterium sp.]RUP35024.1 MAG: hypothetical protein EKK51_00250 [Mycolicibacterium sp.]
MATPAADTASDPYDIAEALADAVDPCLTDAIRNDVWGMLHAGEAHIALSDLVRAIASTNYPVPTDILAALRRYVDDDLATSTPDQWGHDVAVGMHRLLPTIHDSGHTAGTIGTYGDAHMPWIIISDAGLTDDSPRDQKVAAIKAWLANNKPGWALRFSATWDGFGDLIGAQKP